MKITRHFVIAVVSIACFSLSSHAQRQTTLYIDNGFGVFTKLTTPSGNGGTLQFPPGTGMLVMEPPGSPAGTGLILQPNPAPGTAQTGNFNITGSGTIGTTLFATDIEDLVSLTINTVAGKNTTIGNSSGTTSISGSGWGITTTGAATLTSISGLTTPLSIGQGGTGQSSFATGVLTSNGSAISSGPIMLSNSNFISVPSEGLIQSNGSLISSGPIMLSNSNFISVPSEGLIQSSGSAISSGPIMLSNSNFISVPSEGLIQSSGSAISSGPIMLSNSNFISVPSEGLIQSSGSAISSGPIMLSNSNFISVPSEGLIQSSGSAISSGPIMLSNSNFISVPSEGLIQSSGSAISSGPIMLSNGNFISVPSAGVIQSSGTAISSGAINLTSATYVSGTLPLGNGGTNNNAYTSGKFIAYDGTSLSSTAYDNTSFAAASGSGSYIQNGTSQQSTADFNISDSKPNGSIATITNNGDHAGNTATELTLIDAPGATGTHIGININVAGGASPSYDITGSNSSWNIKNNGNFTTNGTIETGNPSTGGALVIMQGLHSYTLQAATGGSANPTFQLPANAAGTYTLATTADISSAVATGTAGELAIYTGTNAVGSDATLADDGTTLTYSGTGGIDATNGGVTTNVTSAAAFYAQNGGFWSGTNGSVAGTLSLSDAVHSFAGKLQTIATGLSGNQVYSLPDATGTLALTSDITTAVSGTQNYVAKFGLGGNTVGNSLIFDNGTNVGIGTANPVSLFANTSANTAFPGGSQGSGTGALTWATNSGGYTVSINNTFNDPTAHGLGIGVADNTGAAFGINVTNTHTATSLFSVLANGNTSVAGTLSSEGNSTIGTNSGTANSFGSGEGDLNNIGVGDGVTNNIGNDVTSAGGTTNDIGIEAFGGAITNNIGITLGTGSIVTNNIGVNSENGAATVTNNFGVDVYGTATVVNNYGAANTTNNFYGTSSFTGSVNLALSTDPLKINGSAGTSGYVLTSGGPSAAPSWTQIPTGNFIMNQITQQSAADFNITDDQANASVATITNTGDVAAEIATELTLNDGPGTDGEHIGLSFDVAGGIIPSYDVYGTSGNWKVDNSGNLLTNGTITSTAAGTFEDISVGSTPQEIIDDLGNISTTGTLGAAATTITVGATNQVAIDIANTGTGNDITANDWNVSDTGLATFNGGLILGTNTKDLGTITLNGGLSDGSFGILETAPLGGAQVTYQLPAVGTGTYTIATTGNVVVLNPSTAQTIQPTDDAIVPLTVEAHSNSQSADLQDWDNNLGGVQAFIDNNGDGSFQSLTASNAPGTGIAVLNVSNTNGSGTNIVAELTETVGAGNTHEGLVFNVAGATHNYDIVGTGVGTGNWNVSSLGAGTFASVTNTGHVIATSNGTAAETGSGVTVTDKPVFIITGTFGGTVTSSLPASGIAAGDMIVVINESNTLEQFTLTQTAGIAPGASRTFYWDGSHWQ